MAVTIGVLQDIKQPAIVFSSKTFTITKYGEKDFVKPYYDQMQKAIRNMHNTEESIKTGIKLGLTREEMVQTVHEMTQEFHYLDLPCDQEVVNQLQTEQGLKDYLQSIDRLIIVDEGNEEEVFDMLVRQQEEQNRQRVIKQGISNKMKQQLGMVMHPTFGAKDIISQRKRTN